MNIIQTHTVDTRKPAFRWLGYGESAENSGSAHNLRNIESRKRAFGTDVTNINFKKSKVDSSIGKNLNLNFTYQKQYHECSTRKVDRSNMEDDSKDGSKSYQFGPFAPVTVARIGALEHSNPRRVHDWESLSSTYRPQYQNQGIKSFLENIV